MAAEASKEQSRANHTLIISIRKDMACVRRALRLITGIVAVLTPLAAVASTCVDADLLVNNAHIITMDPAHRVASSMAVRDGKILALGSDDELSRCASARTLVADLHGKTVLPGLIDIHTHALQWAKSVVMGMIDAGYPAVKSIHEVVETVRARVAKANPGTWVMGAYWDDAKLAEHRYITRHDLDAVAPDNPVVLTHGSGHLLVANSAALKLAGITRDTPDPQGGVIERD